MSEFSEAMGQSWAAALTVFGDTVTIGGTPYPCIIHIMNATDGVVAGRPGRSAASSGDIVMLLSDWLLAGGKKGLVLTFDFGVLRSLNDPLYGPTSTEVLINVGPNT